ncbi:MAG TPA: hypothetical protein VKA78_16895, partial [Pyrinomonadaceae bacterium]|nr:hypothetical protein [Pyrinomonadaceae bacterium]
MNRRRSLFAFFFVAAILAVAAIAPFIDRTRAQSVASPGNSAAATRSSSDSKITYPETKKVEQVDDYFGTKVADPYRWLEDETSSETKAWIEDQNRVTFGYLDTIPYREKLKARLTQLYNYPRISAPFRRGETYFFTKNDGLQNQSVYYIQKGVDGTPEVFLDPNKFSPDGTSVLSTFSLSKDGKYVAYGISQGGSDWTTLSVMEVDSRNKLADEVKWMKASGVAWMHDGFYYSRYPEPAKGKELSSKNEFHAVYFHKVGTPQSEDVLIYEDKAHPQRFQNVDTSEDERFEVLTISDRGTGKKGNAIFYRDSSKGEEKFSPIIAEIGEDSFGVIDNVGDKFLIRTNRKAPNGRVVLVDPKNPDEKNWRDVLPERTEPLQGTGTGGGKLFASWRKDVATRAYVFSLDGKLENEIVLPGVGTAGGFGGLRDDKHVFYGFTSFNFPQTIYKYDIATKK